MDQSLPSNIHLRAGWKKRLNTISCTIPYLPLTACAPQPRFVTTFFTHGHVFPLLLEATGRAQSHRREGIRFLRRAPPAVGKTKHREDTNSIPRRSPVLSFSNHAAILLLEQDHFKHAIMLGIVQSSTQAPQVHQIYSPLCQRKVWVPAQEI